MKVLRRVIVILVVLGIAGGLAYYKYINTVTRFNEPGTNGNTVGNLYGKGLFCEYDGVVYFANPNDGSRLYKMNPDESDIDIVNGDSVYFLNSDEHYVYYSRNKSNSSYGGFDVNANSLCRMAKRNGKIVLLDVDDCNACALAGNRIVYYHYDAEEATTLYIVGIDGKDKQQLSPSSIDPRCMVGEKLYYSGVKNDHNLHAMNLDTKDSSFVSDKNLWMPIILGDTLYYMNLDDKERVYRAPLSGGEGTMITQYGTSGYNISGNYLYYQSIKGNPDGLYRVDLTSGAEVLIKEGEFNNINVTSEYIYFADFFSGTTFHVKNGGTQAEVFDPPIIEIKE